MARVDEVLQELELLGMQDNVADEPVVAPVVPEEAVSIPVQEAGGSVTLEVATIDSWVGMLLQMVDDLRKLKGDQENGVVQST